MTSELTRGGKAVGTCNDSLLSLDGTSERLVQRETPLMLRLSLSMILLVMLFGVLRYAGDAGTPEVPGPFAEMPGAQPHEIMMPVPPLSGEARSILMPTHVSSVPDVAATQVEEGLPKVSEPAVQAETPAEPAPVRLGIDLTNALEQAESALALIDEPAGEAEAEAAPLIELPDFAQPEAVVDEATASLSSPTDSEPNEDATDGPLIVEATVTGSSVNLRAGPSTGEPIVGRATLGEVVRVISTPALGWAIIKHPDFDQNVFISAQFLQILDRE